MPSRRCCMMLGTWVALSGSPVLAQVFPRPGQKKSMPGSAVAFGCGFNDTPTAPIKRRVRHSSGDSEVDELLRVEVPALKRHFKLTPTLEFHDGEGSGEAWTIYEHPTITVSLGRALIQDERHVMGDLWKSAVTGIVAHEWAHAFQYERTLTEQVYMWETHADFLAGWYLGARIAAGERWLVADAFARSLSAKRNGSGFFDPKTHGSSKQRTAAMYAGLSAGKRSFHPRLPPDVEEAAEQGFAYAKGTLPARST